MHILFFMAFLFGNKPTPLEAQSCDDAYGMVRDEHDRVHFVSYNTANNVQTWMHDFGVMKLWGNPIRKGFLNEAAKTYYCLADTETSYETQLISIDVETGNVKSILPLGFVQILDYDISNNKFYGVRWTDDNNGYYQDFICVDPYTQTITILSNFISGLYYGADAMIIDPVQRKFYVWAYKTIANSWGRVLLTIDLETGVLLSDVFITDFFTDLHYDKKNNKFYGISSDNTNSWFALFDPTVSAPQHIVALAADKTPWFNNALINQDKNLFLYYATDAETNNSTIIHNHLISLDLYTGTLVKSLKITEGPSSYVIYDSPMGSVWHPSGCTTPTHPNLVIHIPNLFTPNSDGVNDMFEIEQFPKGQASLTIYNAWGTLVYSNSAYANNWNAEHQEDGIYYYDLTTQQDQKNYHGWVQVLR